LQCDEQSAISLQSHKFNVVTINNPAVHILKEGCNIVHITCQNTGHGDTHIAMMTVQLVQFITMIRNY